MLFNLATAVATANILSIVSALPASYNSFNATEAEQASHFVKRNGKSYCCAENLGFDVARIGAVPEIGVKKTDSAWYNMHVFTEGWGHDGGGCGGGFLDNLRGQCGPTHGWGCAARNYQGVDGTAYSFTIHSLRWPECVQNAIWLASPPDHREENVSCKYLCTDEEKDL